MPYDYAPRLALLARNRRRRHVLLTAGLLMLTAASFNATRSAADAPVASDVQLAQSGSNSR